MRLDRGTFWTLERQSLARKLLANGYGREMVAMRFGVTRVAMREAINRHKLDQPQPEARDG